METEVQESVRKMVTDMSDFVNTYNSRNKSESFCELMGREHRTLQQSFTKLCFMWMEYVASPEYRTDGRNVASHETSKLLLDLFSKHYAKDYSGETLTSVMGKPSNHLPFI
jgi:hypothetical protein